MGELILITGGARSGKSHFAESLAISESGAKQSPVDLGTDDGGCEVIYIATSVAVDEEMVYRIKKHRERRPQSWKTFEMPYGISSGAEFLDVNGKLCIYRPVILLIDCITIMISNIMLSEITNWERARPSDIEKAEEAVIREMNFIISLSKRQRGKIIVVSNEVGMGLVPPNVLGRAFRDYAGRANQMLAGSSDAVYFCVSGIPIKIK